jgi:signal transduction histidine kinase
MNINIYNLLARCDRPALLVDDCGKAMKANASFASMTGFDSERMAGKPLEALFSREGPEKPFDDSVVLLTANDDSLRFRVAELPLDGKKGGARLLLFFEGIDPGFSLSDDLHMARLASLGKVLSGIIHEMSNPLAVIHGSAQLLCTQELPSEIEEDVLRIRSEAERTSDLVKKVLSFARKDSHKRERFHVQEVVEEASVLKMCSLKSDKIKIESRHEHGRPMFVYGYKTQLTQVILNLLNNSEQAIREGSGRGMIGIRTDRKRDQAMIAVSDTGPGIAPKNRRKIFDAFFTTKEEKTGTGLGLYISRKIIRDHGGDLDLSGSGRDETIFQISLPLWQPDGARESDSRAEGAGLA